MSNLERKVYVHFMSRPYEYNSLAYEIKDGYEVACQYQMRDGETVIITAEPIKAEEPKKGKWLVLRPEDESFCSVCGKAEDEFIYGTEMWYGKGESNYCPNCGADMRGEE